MATKDSKVKEAIDLIKSLSGDDRAKVLKALRALNQIDKIVNE